MLEAQSAEKIIERLALARDEALRARRDAECVLAFDADGTLWSGDVGEDLFEAFLAAKGAREEARAALAAEAEALGLAASGSAHDVAHALYEAFRAGTYHEARAFAMMAWAFAGWLEHEVHAFARGMLRDTSLAERLHRELDPVLAWARASDVAVWVVSASPYAAVVEGVALRGVPAGRVLAMQPAVREGRLEAWLGGPVVYGEGKLEALRGARAEAVLLGGFGDSSYDAAFLRAARVPVAVRPKASLLLVADTVPGLVAIRG